MGTGPSGSWWDELDLIDGPTTLRVRAVGDQVRLVVEVGDDRVDVQLPAMTALELGSALVEVAGGGDGADHHDGAPQPGRGVGSAPVGPETEAGHAPAPRSWAEPAPNAADARAAVEASLVHLRRLCEVLPETVEVDTLGDPSFRVATRMFAVVETTEEVPVVRFKATPEEQAELVGDERFRPDPETGHRGWTALRLDAVEGGHDLERVVLSSFRLVAPPDLVAQLDASLDAAGEDAAD